VDLFNIIVRHETSKIHGILKGAGIQTRPKGRLRVPQGVLVWVL